MTTCMIGRFRNLDYRFGELLCRPTARQRHDRLDAVCLALVTRRSMGGTQLGELFGGPAIVEPRDDGTSTSTRYASPPFYLTPVVFEVTERHSDGGAATPRSTSPVRRSSRLRTLPAALRGSASWIT